MNRPLQRHTVTVFVLIFLFVAAACRPSANLPPRSSSAYNEIVRAFYIGLAALQVGHDVQADSKLAQVTQLAPSEPAGWANWGLLALRQRNFDAAAERLERARTLASDNDQIYYLIGLLESSRGRSAEAIAALRRAVELNPKNLIATFKLAEEVERQGDESGTAEFQQLLQQILKAQPDNLAALLELSRVAAKRGDAATLKSAVAQITARSSTWPPEVQQQLVTVQTAAAGSDPRAAATRTTFLRNVLMRVPEYRRDLGAIKPPPGEEAVPFTRFLRLESPIFKPAAADPSLTFKAEPVSGIESNHWTWSQAISLSGSSAPVVTVANDREVQLASGAKMTFPGGSPSSSPTFDGITPVDLNYDFKTDLVLAGAGGVRLMRQDDPKNFHDVTQLTKLPATVL
ncbi:MAG TPA: tetratricopeptide repeat protein, partial [Pyrinomonadaceae bacterium]|nr:tetratricopeptide repeat protein [Pyrinomonadaceae bacterium]